MDIYDVIGPLYSINQSYFQSIPANTPAMPGSGQTFPGEVCMIMSVQVCGDSPQQVTPIASISNNNGIDYEFVLAFDGGVCPQNQSNGVGDVNPDNKFFVSPVFPPG